MCFRSPRVCLVRLPGTQSDDEFNAKHQTWFEGLSSAVDAMVEGNPILIEALRSVIRKQGKHEELQVSARYVACRLAMALLHFAAVALRLSPANGSVLAVLTCRCSIFIHLGRHYALYNERTLANPFFKHTLASFPSSQPCIPTSPCLAEHRNISASVAQLAALSRTKTLREGDTSQSRVNRVSSGAVIKCGRVAAVFSRGCWTMLNRLLLALITDAFCFLPLPRHSSTTWRKS